MPFPTGWEPRLYGSQDTTELRREDAVNQRGAAFMPLQRAMLRCVWKNPATPALRTVKRRERRALGCFHFEAPSTISISSGVRA